MRLSAALAALLVLTACTPANTPVPVTETPPSAATPSPFSNPVKAPDEQQLAAILADFEAYAEQARVAHRIPGMAIAVVSQDKVLFSRGFGETRAGGEAVTVQTLFQIGSTSKAFTATLMAMLVAEGKLSWNDKVSDLLPEFRLHDAWLTNEFRLHDLMAQHSGLTPYGGDLLLFLGEGTRQEIVDKVSLLKPTATFRKDFGYMNNMFVVAGQIIEKVTGKSWEQNIRERIFTPLGMSASSTNVGDLLATSHAATGHYFDPTHAVAGSLPTPTAFPSTWPFHGWIDVVGPAGSLNSTVQDMARWVQLQLGRGTRDGVKLLEEAQLSYLQTPATVMGGGNYYGHGWVYTESRPYSLVWHNGETMGMHSIVAFAPAAGVGMVVLTNSIGHTLPEALMGRFFSMYGGQPLKDNAAESLQKAIANIEPLSLPPDASPSFALATYTGTYQNAMYGPIEVVVENNGLKAYVGPRRVAAPLASLGGHEFVTRMDPMVDFAITFIASGSTITRFTSERTQDALEPDFVKQ